MRSNYKMSQRKNATITGLLGAVLLIGLAGKAQASVVVTAAPPGSNGVTTDLFDASKGSTVVASTPTVDGGGFGVGFPAINAIGGTGSLSDQAIFQDGSDALQSFTFKTIAPVTIGGVNLLLAEDGPTISRGFKDVSLFGSSDGVNFVQLFTADLGTNPYATTFGSNLINLAATFAPVTDQYFRFDGTPFSKAFPSNGGRILELDAVAGTIAAGVPEPATWALMIAGFGMVGAAMRRRASQAVRVTYA